MREWFDKERLFIDHYRIKYNKDKNYKYYILFRNQVMEKSSGRSRFMPMLKTLFISNK